MKPQPKEKVFKVRKRRKASKGHVIRVSDLVLNYINMRRKNNRKALSHDAYFREIFGLPERENESQWIKNGRPALLLEGYVDGFIIPGTRGARFFIHEADANGAMIQDYAKKKINRQYKPIRVREVK